MHPEPITEILEKIGDDLKFNTFTIKGIPGFELVTLYKGETSLYEVEKQTFRFQIASTDVEVNTVADGDAFTLTDTTYHHNFVVDRTPLPDLTGWSVLYADQTGRSLV